MQIYGLRVFLFACTCAFIFTFTFSFPFPLKTFSLSILKLICLFLMLHFIVAANFFFYDYFLIAITDGSDFYFCRNFSEVPLKKMASDF